MLGVADCKPTIRDTADPFRVLHIAESAWYDSDGFTISIYLPTVVNGSC